MKKNTKTTQNTKNKKQKIKITEITKLSKTKKIIIASVAAVLCIAIVFAVVMCNSIHPIEKFGAKLLRKQNFQMEITLSGIPIFGVVSMIYEMDGNIIHMPDMSFIDECYIETVDDIQYTYTKDDSGKWVKEKGENGSFSDLLKNEMLQQLVNPDNYELVEGTKNVYRQKADVEIPDCKNVTITLDRNSCKIKMITFSDGMALEAQIVISKIGKIRLEVPQVE